MKSTSRGFLHLLEAWRNSLAGLGVTFREETAFRQICFYALPGGILAFFLADAWQTRILLLLPLFLAIIVELLNTAIENVVDLTSPEWHSLAKKAKDAASAAQFCAQILVAVVWLGFLLHKL